MRTPHTDDNTPSKSGASAGTSSPGVTDEVSAAAEDAEPLLAGVTKLLSSNRLLSSAAAGGLLCLSAVGYAAAHPELIDKGVSFVRGPSRPSTPKLTTVMYEWTYDSSEKDPAKRIQHRVWTFRGSSGTWTYNDPDGVQADGVATMIHAMNGSLGLLFGPKDDNGPSMGAVFVRPLRLMKAPKVIWVGFETGHDCTCGKGMAHDGPFTSIPAILSTTPDVPEYVQKIVFKKDTVTEPFSWPEDVIDALKSDGQAAQR